MSTARASAPARESNPACDRRGRSEGEPSRRCCGFQITQCRSRPEGGTGQATRPDMVGRDGDPHPSTTPVQVAGSALCSVLKAVPLPARRRATEVAPPGLPTGAGPTVRAAPPVQTGTVVMRNMYYVFLIMQRGIRSVKPFGCLVLRVPRCRCTYSLGSAAKTIDSAHVRPADDSATVKSSQVVPARGENTTWPTRGFEARSSRAV